MLRMIVDGRAFLDERVHVCNGDQHLDIAARQSLGNRELVEVQGVVIVDGAPQELTQIADRIGARLGRCIQPVELGEGLR